MQKLPFSILLALAAAMAFWVSLPLRPYAGSVLVKIAAMLLLSLFAWQRRQAVGVLFFVALLAHTLGDALLEIDRKALFIPAMAAFFSGHVMYALCLARFKTPLVEWSGRQRAGIALIALFAGGLYRYLAPHLNGIIAIAVPIYIGGILSMAAFAILGRWRQPWIVVGALSYMLSDSLIALDAFVAPLGVVGSLTIWPTYIGAQILITYFFVRHAEQQAAVQHA